MQMSRCRQQMVDGPPSGWRGGVGEVERKREAEWREERGTDEEEGEEEVIELDVQQRRIERNPKVKRPA